MRAKALFLLALLLVAYGFFHWLRSPSAPPSSPPPPARAIEAPSPPPLEAPAPAPSIPRANASSLLRAIQADDLCATQGLLERMNFLESPELFPFLTALNAPADLLGLFSPTGPLYGPPAPTPTAPASRFFLALRLAELSEYGPETLPDLNRARALLRQLEAEDPTNAAFPFFRLAVERKLGLPLEQLSATATAAARGRRFDTFLPRLMRELLPLRWRSASYHLAVSTLLSSLLNIHYGEAVAVFRYVAPSTPGAGAAVGRLMVESFTPKSTDPADLSAEHGWGLELSGETVPEETQEELRPEAPEISSAACNREYYDEYFSQQREGR